MRILQALSFYLFRPFIHLIALLPFGALYVLSDCLCFVLKLSGYRRKTVLANLTNSFPGKSRSQIKAIYNAYYRYLSDLIMETLKTLRMTEAEINDRCVFHGAEWLDKLREEKQSIIVVMGHYGNWEWAGPSFTLNADFQLVVIYRPLTNPYFEKMMSRMRTRFGTRITPVNSTLRDMVANRGQLTATAFIADQTATPENAYWTTFLHQKTPVFVGPEKLARKFGYPVVYMGVRRTGRGRYGIFPELLFAHPKDTADGEILEAFMQRLEREITADPAIWLWSHRRWKHAYPENSELITP